MPQRLALTLASAAAALVLTVGLVAGGFVPLAAPAGPADATSDDVFALEDASPEPEVVYVEPAPTPETIVLKKQDKAKKAGSPSSRTKSARPERTSSGMTRRPTSGARSGGRKPRSGARRPLSVTRSAKTTRKTTRKTTTDARRTPAWR